MKRTVLAIVLGVALSTTSAFALAQHVTNGDFAQGLTAWSGFSRTSTNLTSKYNSYVSAYVNTDTQKAVLSNIYSTNIARREARGGQPVSQTFTIDTAGQYVLGFDTAKATSNWLPSNLMYSVGIAGVNYSATLATIPVATMSTAPVSNQIALNIPTAGTYTISFKYSHVTLAPYNAAVITLDNVSVTPVI